MRCLEQELERPQESQLPHEEIEEIGQTIDCSHDERWLQRQYRNGPCDQDVGDRTIPLFIVWKPTQALGVHPVHYHW